MITRPGKYLRSMYFAPWDTKQCLPMNEMIDIKGVANELAVSTRSIQFWESKGWMPHRQLRGKQLVYRRVDIENVKTALELIANYG
jgi:hypothetical protein